jgi:hypothetical protein
VQTTTTTLNPVQGDQLVDPDALICPGCIEPVRCAPPGYWVVREGLPVPAFSHQDATPLCRTRAGVVAEPIEVAR